MTELATARSVAKRCSVSLRTTANAVEATSWGPGQWSPQEGAGPDPTSVSQVLCARTADRGSTARVRYLGAVAQLLLTATLGSATRKSLSTISQRFATTHWTASQWALPLRVRSFATGTQRDSRCGLARRRHQRPSTDSLATSISPDRTGEPEELAHCDFIPMPDHKAGISTLAISSAA